MSQNDLRILLKHRGDVDQRQVLLHAKEGVQLATHVKIDLAGQHLGLIVHRRPTRNDGHIKAAGGIGAVSDRLVKATMLGLCDPVGAERCLDIFGQGRAGQGNAGGQCHDGQTRCAGRLRLEVSSRHV